MPLSLIYFRNHVIVVGTLAPHVWNLDIIVTRLSLTGRDSGSILLESSSLEGWLVVVIQCTPGSPAHEETIWTILSTKFQKSHKLYYHYLNCIVLYSRED